MNGKWQELPTTLVDESPSYLYYEAQSPGFSIFAISAEGVPSPSPGLPLALYATVAAGFGTAGLSLFYWFRRRRIKPSVSLEDIKQTVMGREEKTEVDEEEKKAKGEYGRPSEEELAEKQKKDLKRLEEIVKEKKEGKPSETKKRKLTPLMKQYEEETGKNARRKDGELTKAYKKWRRKRRRK
ncbi:hypothetical protein AKJ48_00120 [candidate division MSBL1 archaeon SCGC-AAA261O19]|uniref:Uncharacterized protein n=3 Tax=candidate division MSBL1 TaxID=215777 RepID=A0A133VF81_9EURY|nr:hypothetical protein AKJ48_00120 [candidate division MSBL1 archaeon SCGC-AAA261O19]